MTETKAPSKILVAIDFSENSDRALGQAIDHAKHFGASIDLVHALASPIPGASPYEVIAPVAYINDMEKAARAKLEEARQRVEAAGVQVRSHVARAPASSAIAALADELQPDLIMMGCRGHTGLKHVLLGSVADRTLRHAPCSVLVVR